MTILFIRRILSLTINPTKQPDLPTYTSRTHETNLNIFQSSCYASAMTFTRCIHQMNRHDRFSTSSPTPTPTLLTPRFSTVKTALNRIERTSFTRNTTDTCIHVNEEYPDIRDETCDAHQKQIFIIMKGVKCEGEILLPFSEYVPLTAGLSPFRTTCIPSLPIGGKPLVHVHVGDEVKGYTAASKLARIGTRPFLESLGRLFTHLITHEGWKPSSHRAVRTRALLFYIHSRISH